MRLRKILMLPAVVSLSAIFAFGSVAQQEEGQVNDKVRELQEQYRRLLKNEYNPSTIEPKTNGKPSFSGPGWMKSSKRSKAKNQNTENTRRKGREPVAHPKRRVPAKSLPGAGRASSPGTLQEKHSVKRTASAKTSAAKGPKSSRASPPKGARSSAKGAKSSGKTAKKVSKSRVSKRKEGNRSKVAGKKGQPQNPPKPAARKKGS